MYYYFVTIKLLNKRYPVHADYEALLCAHFPYAYFTYEYDSLNKLHYHLIYVTGQRWDFTKFLLSGYSVHSKKLANRSDMFRVMKYIHKDYVNNTHPSPPKNNIKYYG